MWKLALITFAMAAAGVYAPASLPSPAFGFANDTRGEAVFKGIPHKFWGAAVRKAPSCPLGKTSCRRRRFPQPHLTCVPWVVATD